VDARLVRIPQQRVPALAASADEVARELDSAEGSDRELDLGEAWAGIHFLLTGEVPVPREVAERLGVHWDEDSPENALMGGSPTPFLGSFGPARYRSPGEVARTAARLREIGVEEFHDRYDADALEAEQIPPDGWDDEGRAQEWLTSSYARLQRFYDETAADGAGLVVYFV
jgi:hypothetical protein